MNAGARHDRVTCTSSQMHRRLHVTEAHLGARGLSGRAHSPTRANCFDAPADDAAVAMPPEMAVASVVSAAVLTKKAPGPAGDALPRLRLSAGKHPPDCNHCGAFVTNEPVRQYCTVGFSFGHCSANPETAFLLGCRNTDACRRPALAHGHPRSGVHAAPLTVLTAAAHRPR